MANPSNALWDAPLEWQGNGGSGANDALSGGDSAYRNSVAGTQGGTYSQSGVYSITKNLMFAYQEVECDSPARSRA